MLQKGQDGQIAIKEVTINDKVVKLEIWHLAGQWFRLMVGNPYRRALGIVVVYDITDPASFNSVKEWLTELEHYATSNLITLLVGNKADLNEERAIDATTAKDFAAQHDVLYSETSAKAGQGVEDAFMLLTAEVLRRRENIELQKQSKILLRLGEDIGKQQ